jgi:hypothetical protein
MKTVYYYDSGKWQAVTIGQEFNTVNLSAQLGPWYDNVPIDWVRQNIGVAQLDAIMPRRTLRGLGIPTQFYTGVNPPPGTYGGQQYYSTAAQIAAAAGAVPVAAPAPAITPTVMTPTPVVQAVIAPVATTTAPAATTPAPTATPTTAAATTTVTPPAAQSVAPAQSVTDNSAQTQTDYVAGPSDNSGISTPPDTSQTSLQPPPSSGISPIMLLLGGIALLLALN